MKKKQLVILASIVLVLLSIIGLQRLISEQSKQSLNKSYAVIKKKNIQRLAISKGNKTLSIKKKNDIEWDVETFPASQERIDQLINSLASLSTKTLVSENKDKQKLYNVTSKNLNIQIYETEEEPILSFYIGKQGPTWGSSYIRYKGEPNVYLVEGIVSYLFEPNLAQWKNLKLPPLNIFSLDSFTVNGALKSYGYVKKNNEWFQENSTITKNISEVSAFLNASTNFFALDLFKTSPELEKKIAKNKAPLQLEFKEKETKVHYTFSKKEKDFVYLKISNMPQYIYKINHQDYQNIELLSQKYRY